ncbi:hypothetical protein VTJ49DRAFT_3777 [Mycothermus thermophilus]|uniref:DNA polymerase eta n=1 Tax=Humicola insolens TaxID=85995 RepID=A0ABR3V6S2_HUMIN
MVSARHPETRWVTRCIPFVLAGCAGFATYTVVKRICVDFFIAQKHQNGTAAAFLALYFVLFLLALATYLRLFIVIQLDPGVTPLGPKALEQKAKVKDRSRRQRDLEACGRYEARPDDDPDSPGLELFYTKDVFVCETDGRPRWCSTCCNWKIDRAHHCSEIERCVRKMDHYCPWVGGIVGETSFKFFVQFTFYTTLYCCVVIVACAFSLQAKVRDRGELDGVIIGALAVAAMFGLFTFTMTAMSVRSILVNLTTVDNLKAKRVVHQLAVRVPLGTPPGPNYNVITYPLPKPPHANRNTTATEPLSARDQLASRTYAIVRTEMGENPWDLGFWRNWTSVMGRHPLDWFLPINPSPKYESSESLYEMGPVYKKLRQRFGLPELDDAAGEKVTGQFNRETRLPRNLTPPPSTAIDDDEIEERIKNEEVPAPAFRDSSPAASSQKRSRFTYRNLSQMASSMTSCPLRVIAHMDLDCFYAQCEIVRLGIPEDQPLAVQQWKGLIAINYPARAFGISRMCNIVEAKKMCPNLIAQHVATWREGDDKWAYRPDAAENIATDKVSLDPYRLESRKILALIKEQLPPHLQKVEKASIDEVFLDLSAHVHAVLLERFPELCNPPPDGDPSTPLPMPPVTALDWQADALVDLDDESAELDDPDWDDVAFLIASEIVRNVRAAIRARLRYTCSAGIARNKLLSKLGSAYKKPNQQTVIRNRAVRYFLSGFKFTSFRNLGGKLGEQVSQIFGTESVSDLLAVPVEQLQQRLGEETGTWVYNTLRGIDTSEVSPRTQIKSMLSAKAFRAPWLLTTPEQATRWLRIFVADIFARLVDEGVLENRRRPRTLSLHFLPSREGSGSGRNPPARSRQCPIPMGRSLDEETLLALARGLLHQIAHDVGPGQSVWPCAHLSMSVAGFEDAVAGNMGIDGFLLKDSGEAGGARLGEGNPDARLVGEVHASVDVGGGGGTYLDSLMVENAEHRDGLIGSAGLVGWDASAAATVGHAASGGGGSDASRHVSAAITPAPETAPGGGLDLDPIPDDDDDDDTSATAMHTTTPCPRCGIPLPPDDAMQRQSHADWHFAKDLQEQEEAREGRGRMVFGGGRGGGTSSAAAAAGGVGLGSGLGSGSGSGSGSNKAGGRQLQQQQQNRGKKGGGGRPGKTEKGQTRLAFG